jgi:hypothetical protein
MQFERTTEPWLVRRILTRPEIYPYMVSDGAPAREDWAPTIAPHLWYVLVWDAGELLGMFFCVPFSPVLWEIHTCFFPGVGARRAIAAYKAGLDWLGAHTTCKKVLGMISADNPRALVVALRGGASKVGVLTKSIRKGGALLDQMIVAADVVSNG